MKNMLEAREITKSFKNLQVLKGVNLQINEGEITSIVGQSGSGKSTLLYILGTLDHPDSGEVYIDGYDVSTMKEKDLAHFRNVNIGFVFQFHHLLAEFSALENVMIPALINKVNKSKSEQRAKELLDYLGLSKRMTHKPNQLSGGEQQRVAMARALINQPKIVFADEPSGNLDQQNSEELHQLLFNLRQDFNQTFVIVTHNQQLANRSDRKLALVNGKINS